MLDLPEQPRNGNAKADNNGKEQECESRRRERGRIHDMIVGIKKRKGHLGEAFLVVRPVYGVVAAGT